MAAIGIFLSLPLVYKIYERLKTAAIKHSQPNHRASIDAKRAAPLQGRTARYDRMDF